MSEAAASLATYGYGLQAPITSTTSFQESQGRATPRVGMKGANQLVSPSPKLSFGLSSSSLITITTMYEDLLWTRHCLLYPHNHPMK